MSKTYLRHKHGNKLTDTRRESPFTDKSFIRIVLGLLTRTTTPGNLTLASRRP